MDKTIISIGHFTDKDIRDRLGKSDVRIYAYDPQPDVCQEYSEIKNGRFTYYQLAVHDDLRAGYGVLVWPKSHHRVSCTTCMRWREDFWKRGVLGWAYPVKVVSLASILAGHESIDELHIDCEGAEIDMLLNTPIELLEKCRLIWVEFHNHSKVVNVTYDDIEQCVRKVKDSFSCRVVNSDHPDYEFRRI